MSNVRIAIAKLVRGLAYMMLTCWCSITWSQRLPDAGQILRETKPTTPPIAPEAVPAPLVKPPETAPEAPTTSAPFVLQGIRFSGNSVFSDSELNAYAADKLGKLVTFEDLEEVTQRITLHYGRGGYFLAQAVLPLQRVVDGIVEVSIVEGRLGKIRIERARETPVPERLVRGFLNRLREGDPLRQQDLESGMLLLTDVPGLVAQSSLEQGEQGGTVDLLLEINASRRWDLSVDADNFGSRAVGEYRLGMLGRLRSPFGLGDNLDVRLLGSNGSNLIYGRIGYEAPVNARGTRAAVAVSRVEYELAGDFSALDGTGTADVLELVATHPAVRSRAQNVVVRGGVTGKRLEDKLGAFDLTTEKYIYSANVGFVYEGRDTVLGGGYSTLSANGFLGNLDIRSEAVRVADEGPGGRDTSGHFAKAAYQLARLQSLVGRSSFYLGLAGQFASKNLDSAEKIALGGPGAVRAYSISEGIVDQGHILNAEYRYQVTEDLSLAAFYDAATGRLNRFPRPGENNSVRLRGYGLGMYWSAPYRFTVRASVAWRDTRAPTSETRDPVPRLFAQVVKTF